MLPDNFHIVFDADIQRIMIVWRCHDYGSQEMSEYES